MVRLNLEKEDQFDVCVQQGADICRFRLDPKDGCKKIADRIFQDSFLDLTILNGASVVQLRDLRAVSVPDSKA